MTAKNATAHLKTAADAVEQAADGLEGILVSRQFLTKEEITEAKKELHRIPPLIAEVARHLETFENIAGAVEHPKNGHLP